MTEPAAVAGGAAACFAAAVLDIVQRHLDPELAIRPSPARRLPAPVLMLVSPSKVFPSGWGQYATLPILGDANSAA